MAGQMQHTPPHLDVRIDGGGGLRKMRQPVGAGQQHILDAAILWLEQHLEPEACAFGLAQPKAQQFLGAAERDPQGQIHGLVADAALVTHPDLERVQQQCRMARTQRRRLPGRQLRPGLDRGSARPTWGRCGPLGPFQAVLTFRHVQASGIDRDNVVIQAPQALLAFRHPLALEIVLATL